MSETLLEVKNLRSGYGQASDVLKGVSLRVRKGEAVTILGPNGAGKTTLMNTLMGLVPRRGGEIHFAGQSIHGLATEDRVGRGLILVPEGRRVFPRMSTEENLRVGAHLIQDQTRVQANLEKVLGIFPRLKERLHQPAATFSGGEQQMLALGRALMSEPKLLLLDEPSMGLAPAIVLQVYEVLEELVASGLTVLVVEQNAHVALRVVHRAYVLSQGEVVLEDSAENLRGHSDIERAYLGA